MTDKEILEAMRSMLEAEREHTRQMIQEETAPINARLDTLEGKQDKVSADIANLNHFIKPAFKTIQEGIDGLQERNKRVDALETKVESHDHRLWALEQKAI